MELGEYLAALRKGWIVIVLLALAGGAVGYAHAVSTTPTYRSSSTVFVSLTRGDTVSELVQGATYTQNLVESYTQLATMPVVLDPVIEELGLTTTARALAGTIQADTPLNTVIIEISAVSKSPERAADIANSVARHLAETAKDLAPTAADGAASLEMTVVAEAQASRAPFSPRPRVDTIAGSAAGLALGVLFALARAQLDTRIRTAHDLPTSPSRAILGQIPFDRSLVRRPRALLDDPHSPLAESYRRLRTNLQFLDVSRPLRCFVVTSSVPGEGKSTTAVNLALVMAETGARVLLVDADLRSPSVAEICGLEGGAGLSAVLIRDAEPDDVAQPWGVPGLFVITAGQIPPNPSQLIDSDAMGTFLATVTEQYDLVILDTAPLLAVTDAAVLGRRTDGAVVVARSRKVRRPSLTDALASLDSAGAICLGLLVNGRPVARSELRYGYGAKPGRHSRGLRRFTRRRPPAAAPAAAAAHPLLVDEILTPVHPHVADEHEQDLVQQREPARERARERSRSDRDHARVPEPDLGPPPEDLPDQEPDTLEDLSQELPEDLDDEALSPEDDGVVVPWRRGAAEAG